MQYALFYALFFFSPSINGEYILHNEITKLCLNGNNRFDKNILFYMYNIFLPFFQSFATPRI